MNDYRIELRIFGLDKLVTYFHNKSLINRQLINRFCDATFIDFYSQAKLRREE